EGPVGIGIGLARNYRVFSFQDMKGQNVLANRDWKLYSVKLPYSEDAEQIQIAGMFYGTGKIWIDDFEVLIDGKTLDDAPHKKPKEYKGESETEFELGS